MLAELAHRAEHRDPPLDVALLAKALQRRRHRRRVGVVAFVDQQQFAAVDRAAGGARRGPSARPCRPARARRRATSAPTASTAASTASALDTQCSPRWEMVKVSSLSSSARGDQAAAIVGERTAWSACDVGIAMAEGDDPVGMAPRGLDQPVAVRAVVGDDRDAVGLQPLEDFAPWRRRSPPRAEILDMRRGDGGDQRDMRPDHAGSARRSRRRCSCPFRAPQTRCRAASGRGSAARRYGCCSS